MFNALNRVVASGSTKVFSVPFPYISRTHVKLYINGLDTSYTWVNAGAIELASPPAAGADVVVVRITPITALVSFTRGDLDPEDLNLAVQQARYLAEEAADVAQVEIGERRAETADLNRRLAGELQDRHEADLLISRTLEARATELRDADTALSERIVVLRAEVDRLLREGIQLEDVPLGTLAFKSSVGNAEWATEPLSVANGGTGTRTAPEARRALGLHNVDNTSDANKPVSAAQQEALAQKASVESPTFTGAPRAATYTSSSNSTLLATTAHVKLAMRDAAMNGSQLTAPDRPVGDKGSDVANTAFVTSADTLLEAKAVSRTFPKVAERFGTGLFEGAGTASQSAQELREHLLPFNAETDISKPNRFSAAAKRINVEGGNLNGPGHAALGQSISMFKEGFNRGTAKGGEMDGLYIVMRQDSPRTGTTNQADACGILIDTATFDKVGFVGGIEGMSRVLAEGGATHITRQGYQVGCIATDQGGTPLSVGLHLTAYEGPSPFGLLLSSEAAGSGTWLKPISVNQNGRVICELDNAGRLALRPPTGSNLRSAIYQSVEGNFGVLNDDFSRELLQVNQAGDVRAARSLVSSLVRVLPANAAADPAAWQRGTLFCNNAGELLFCEADGQEPREVPFETAGTWTPELRGSNGTAVSAYTSSGTWLKQGSMVHFTADWNITTVGGASGTLQIANMPFPRSVPTYSLAGRITSGSPTPVNASILGSGGVANPSLTAIFRYDGTSFVTVHAANLAGSYRTAQ